MVAGKQQSHGTGKRKTEDLPGKVATDSRYERLSTDRSDCRLSFASPVGLLLPCNHVYNQYVILDNSEENLRKFEKSPDYGGTFQMNPGKVYLTEAEYQELIDAIKANL